MLNLTKGIERVPWENNWNVGGGTARRLKYGKGNEEDLEEKGGALKEVFEHFTGKFVIMAGY